MKPLFLFFTFLVSTTVFGQTEEIYRLIFSDTSNFKLTTYLDHKLPKTFIVIDTTKTWNPNRFWLTTFDNNDKEKVIKKIQNDEHNPYFHSYIFSDTVLNQLLSDETKRELYSKSKQIKSKPIWLNGSNYKTVSSSKSLKGFYFVISEPIFSADNKFAFTDLTVYYKDSYKQALDETYFGTISIIFQKQNNKWKRIGKKDWLFL